MFSSGESNGISGLQNKIVEALLQPVQFSTTIKHEHCVKANTYTFCVSTKQINCKINFNNTVTKYFCKISLNDFGN